MYIILFFSHTKDKGEKMMKEENELLLHIYKDCDMSITTLNKLLKELKTRDNKIKDAVEDILKEYEKFLKDTKKVLKKEKVEVENNGMMSKVMATMGVKKEVKSDNSDASMADMLIKGITMGTVDMEKKIHQYEKEVNKKDLKFAKEFLKFQQDSIEKLKKYL